MKFGLQHLRTRVIGVALLTAALAVVLVHGTLTVAFQANRPQLGEALPARWIAACQQDPSLFDDVRFGPITLHVWADTEVPPAAAEDVMVARVAEHGQCTWISTRFEGPAELSGALRVALATGAAAAFLLVGLLSYRLTLAPLVRRIRAIRGAAVHVGTPEYGSADDGVGDALAKIASVLDASHARITDDRAELVRRHQALELYLAEIAHDLRTPLASLVLALQENVAAGGSGQAAAARALEDASYVGALVENLHHAARLRHGLDPLEGVADLREIVLRLEVRFRAISRACAVAVSVPEEPVIVRCTPALAERALANLLHNATTHGARHAAAVLEPTPDGGFTLEISDDGPGVAVPADLSLRTFTDDAARPRGPGLGLAITNEVARRVGWEIAYRAGEEGGLVVTLRGRQEGAPPAPG